VSALAMPVEAMPHRINIKRKAITV